jgi:hypothetical protein
MDHHDPARPRRDRRFQARKINLPAVIVDQQIRNEANVCKVREKFKERIAGRGNENFVSLFAEQPENVRVSLARSRSEQDAFGVDALNRPGKSLASTVIFGHRFPRFSQALAFRAIYERARIRESRENFLLWISEPASRGIRRGQVEEFSPAPAMLFESLRQTVRFEAPIRARCKHVGEKIALNLYHAGEARTVHPMIQLYAKVFVAPASQGNTWHSLCEGTLILSGLSAGGPGRSALLRRLHLYGLATAIGQRKLHQVDLQGCRTGLGIIRSRALAGAACSRAIHRPLHSR